MYEVIPTAVFGEGCAAKRSKFVTQCSAGASTLEAKLCMLKGKRKSKKKRCLSAKVTDKNTICKMVQEKEEIEA